MIQTENKKNEVILQKCNQVIKENDEKINDLVKNQNNFFEKIEELKKTIIKKEIEYENEKKQLLNEKDFL